MTAYSTPPTAVAGFPLAAADWNAKVRDSMESVAKPDRCKVRRVAAFNVNNAVETAIPWDTEDYDSDALWAPGTPTRLTAPYSGLYVALMNIAFNVHATGARLYIIKKNGGTEAQIVMPGNPGGWHPVGQVAAEVFLAAGEYLEGFVYQNSGAVLGIHVGEQRWMAVRRVSK